MAGVVATTVWLGMFIGVYLLGGAWIRRAAR